MTGEPGREGRFGAPVTEPGPSGAGRQADDELGAEGQRLAIALAGRDSTWLYDGSLTEWNSRPDLPLVVG